MNDDPVVDNPAGAAAAFGMTELEEQLRGGDGEQIAKGLLARFGKIDAALSARLASGLAPGDYARAVVIRNSLAAASNLLIRIPKTKP